MLSLWQRAKKVLVVTTLLDWLCWVIILGCLGHCKHTVGLLMFDLRGFKGFICNFAELLRFQWRFIVFPTFRCQTFWIHLLTRSGFCTTDSGQDFMVGSEQPTLRQLTLFKRSHTTPPISHSHSLKYIYIGQTIWITSNFAIHKTKQGLPRARLLFSVYITMFAIIHFVILGLFWGRSIHYRALIYIPSNYHQGFFIHLKFLSTAPLIITRDYFMKL